MSLQTRTVDYAVGGTQLTGYFATSDLLASPRPAVLVVHGGAGLDEHARGRARWLAELGYVAFACDMYGRGVAGSRERVMARIQMLRDNPEAICALARSAIEILSAHPQSNGRIAAVGYCFGGMCVLEMARSGMNLAGAVSVHGNLETHRGAAPRMQDVRILVCHGALDPHIPMTQVNAFVEEMNRANAQWELQIFGGAMHGFTHETGPFSPGVAYSPHADRRSRVAIREFLAGIFT
ncbi:MAG TPA: dienelactone hydrolase family protein [Verrucomicrobiae bacterium]|nr:dienelactone hydrolase family protein [Verrucomicrobiae bacterium]